AAGAGLPPLRQEMNRVVRPVLRLRGDDGAAGSLVRARAAHDRDVIGGVAGEARPRSPFDVAVRKGERPGALGDARLAAGNRHAEDVERAVRLSVGRGQLRAELERVARGREAVRTLLRQRRDVGEGETLLVSTSF